MSADKALLELHGVRKSYGEHVAVKDVDLTVHPGQIVGLVGKNGAGKTSLVKTITGVTHRDAGDVILSGDSVDFENPWSAHRAGVAVVHQELNVVPTMSVAENVRLGAGYPRRVGIFVDWRKLRQSARASLRAVGLDDVDPDMLASDLSPVQQRLVMIAAALVHDVHILILDEPTASFADREVRLLHDVMRRLSARGVGIVFISHRLDEVLELTDVVVVMRDGQVVKTVETSTIRKSQLVEWITGQAVPTEAGTPPGRGNSDVDVLAVHGLRTESSEHGASFTVRKGEVLGLAGLVGAGRSELLRAIYGADPRSGGTVRVSGRPLVSGTPGESLDAGLVLLTEDRVGQGLIHNFSVEHNITLASLRRFRRNAHLPVPSPGRERAAGETFVGRLGIKTDGVAASVDSLSGGNQQKVLLARWLAVEPKVLLLDEPTVGIDVGAREDIHELIRALADEGIGVLLVSSEFAQLEQMCHRVLVMSDGEIVAELTGSDITERALLNACFAAVPDDHAQ